MEINGKQLIAAPRQAVWDALNDPAVLKQCLPGCESVERTSPDEFAVVVTSAIGPLRARFNGTLRMTEVDAPGSCVLVFQGQGGPIGFGKGASRVELAEAGASTELTYSAKAEVGGKLAQIGSRLIDGVARKMSDDFFLAFRRVLVPDAPIPVASASGEEPASPAGAVPAPALGMMAPCGAASVARGRFSTPPTWSTVAWAAATSFAAGLGLASLLMAALLALKH
jgi:carbon monoxide dehydrogenase subunit G